MFRPRQCTLRRHMAITATRTIADTTGTLILQWPSPLGLVGTMVVDTIVVGIIMAADLTEAGITEVDLMVAVPTEAATARVSAGQADPIRSSDRS